MTATKISWADESWGIVLGCARKSPGCDGCYAIVSATIRAGNPHPKIGPLYAGLTHRNAEGRLDWTGEVRTVPERLGDPLRWRKPRRVFPTSQGDLFHAKVPTEFIAEAFAVMAATPRHSYLITTKDQARMRSLLSSGEFRALVQDESASLAAEGFDVRDGNPWDTWPLRNVWAGVSVEDQHWADIRIPVLLDTPAAVRWISLEPQLEEVDLHRYLPRDCEFCRGEGRVTVDRFDIECPAEGCTKGRTLSLDWVVCGGESGSTARRADPAWFRKIRSQCAAAAVPFHFKQTGTVLAREWGLESKNGTDPGEWPEPFEREYPA